MSDLWRPKCMTEGEYDDWRSAAVWAYRVAGLPVPPVCVDCHAPFRRSAERAGKCNNIAPRALVAARRERIEALREQGMSWAQVGLQLGITARQAQDTMRRYHKLQSVNGGSTAHPVVPAAGGSVVDDPLRDRAVA